VAGSAEQRYIAVLRDLTERRRMEAEREMGRIAAARAEFLRTLSHELRSPLTAVLGFAQLLRSEAAEPRARRQAQDIEDAGRHMLALVNDLLDLARIDAGRWDIDISDVNATDLLHAVVEGVRPQAAERGLRLDVDTTPSPALIQTDARILREVATNLIENAVKYTERGRIAVHGEVDGETFILTVSDTGLGIPADRLESIFNEFEQLRAAGTEQGVGLGLAITSKLVALVAGTVRVESTPGVGSTFTVRIPVKVLART
jgi:signal transduction histidine kinase